MTRYARLGTPWPRMLGLCAAAAGLMGAVAARPGSLWPLQGLTVGLIAAGTAWCVDEQAAAVVDSLPRTLRWRTIARTLVACPLAITWVLCTLLWRRNLPPHPAVLVLQGIAAMATAVAYGAWRRAHGTAAPGGGFAAAAVTACVALTLVPLNRVESAVFPAWSVGSWRTCGAIWAAMLSSSALVLCVTLRDNRQRTDPVPRKR
jgi:ABC-type sugar transport system permease subunit